MALSLWAPIGCAADSEADDCSGDACTGTTGSAETLGESGGATPGAGDDSTSDDTGGASEGGSGSDESGGASETGEPPSGCADAGSGLELADVSLFQVVEVPLVDDCTEVQTAQRRGPIVAGRVGIVRATVEIPAGSGLGMVAAQVTLESAAGDETLEGDCAAVDADGGSLMLHVDVPGAAIHEDSKYAISVVSCEDDAGLAMFPAVGVAELGAESMGVIRMHLVPFEVGGFVPDTSQGVIDGLRAAVMAMYPVSDVEVTVGPVEPDDNGGQVDMGGLMSRLIMLQEDEVFATGDLDPAVADIYYYGLVTGAATREEFCDSCPTGTSESGVGDRAGSAMGAAFADELSESTLIHEMGHMHGLLHSPCGDPSLQDDRFPYADGLTQTEGWDFRTETFVASDHNDLMGYCQPRWVSDYHYAKMAEWVHLASSWAEGGAKLPPPQHAPARLSCRH